MPTDGRDADGGWHAAAALRLHSCLQRLTLQLGQVEHQQSLAASEAALAPLNPFQRSQVSAEQQYSRAWHAARHRHNGQMSIICTTSSCAVSKLFACTISWCITGVVMCSQVKDCVGEQMQQLVPSLVNSGIAAHVPPMIEEVSMQTMSGLRTRTESCPPAT